MSLARSLELFFIDGRPDGMLTAGVFNWTGHVLRVPRTQLKDGLARKEAGFTGVYVLIGEQKGEPLAYVGEAEDMGTRLRQHAAGKDWWDTAILITTSANNLHKAHVRYLEARLIETARDVASMALENGNQPGGASLSEADTANMENYLDILMMVLPAIRVDNFLSKKRTEASTSEVGASASASTLTGEVAFLCRRARDGLIARALFSKGEMIVQTGSSAASSWIGKDHSSYSPLYDELTRSGAIEDGKFTVDYAFSSPSAAAAVVPGRPANGRTEWKLATTGLTYAVWELEQLSEGAQ